MNSKKVIFIVVLFLVVAVTLAYAVVSDVEIPQALLESYWRVTAQGSAYESAFSNSLSPEQRAMQQKLTEYGKLRLGVLQQMEELCAKSKKELSIAQDLSPVCQEKTKK